MFDVSFTEMMVIGVIALIVIGPERLPKVARTIGHLLGRAQRYVTDVKSDIRREIELDELRKFKSEMDEAAHNVKTSLRETETTLRSELDTTVSEANKAFAQVKQEAEAPASMASAAPVSSPASVDSTGAPVPPASPTSATPLSPEASPTPVTATPAASAASAPHGAADAPTSSSPQPKTPTTP